MAWTILTNSTTADADEVIDNFYHIRQGDLLPLGGASMVATTSVYDIGSSTYTWNNGHFNTIHNNTITTTRLNITSGTANINGDMSIGGDVLIKSGKNIYMSGTSFVNHSTKGMLGSNDLTSGSPKIIRVNYKQEIIIGNTYGIYTGDTYPCDNDKVISIDINYNKALTVTTQRVNYSEKENIILLSGGFTLTSHILFATGTTLHAFITYWTQTS